MNNSYNPFIIKSQKNPAPVFLRDINSVEKYSFFIFIALLPILFFIFYNFTIDSSVSLPNIAFYGIHLASNIITCLITHYCIFIVSKKRNTSFMLIYVAINILFLQKNISLISSNLSLCLSFIISHLAKNTLRKSLLNPVLINQIILQSFFVANTNYILSKNIILPLVSFMFLILADLIPWFFFISFLIAIFFFEMIFFSFVHPLSVNHISLSSSFNGMFLFIFFFIICLRQYLSYSNKGQILQGIFLALLTSIAIHLEKFNIYTLLFLSLGIHLISPIIDIILIKIISKKNKGIS